MIVLVPMEREEREFILKLLYDYKDKLLSHRTQPANEYYTHDGLDCCVKSIVSVNEAERRLNRSLRKNR